MGGWSFTQSDEAYAVEEFWQMLYYLAMVSTLYRYFNKHFADDAAYRWHRRLWWGVILLASVVHFSVATYAEYSGGYACNAIFCQQDFIPFYSGLLLAIVMGPTNRQNTGNKGEEGIIVLCLGLPLIFIALVPQEWFRVTRSFKWPEIIFATHASFVVFMSFFPILLTKLLYSIAGLVGFEGALTKIGKFFLYWLSCLLNGLILLALFMVIRQYFLTLFTD